MCPCVARKEKREDWPSGGEDRTQGQKGAQRWSTLCGKGIIGGHNGGIKTENPSVCLFVIFFFFFVIFLNRGH